MTTPKLKPISSLEPLAALKYSKIQPVRTEYANGRFWAYFDPKQAQPILDQFESGSMQVDAMGFCNALSRVKDQVFEAERANARSGGRIL